MPDVDPLAPVDKRAVDDTVELLLRQRILHDALIEPEHPGLPALIEVDRVLEALVPVPGHPARTQAAHRVACELAVQRAWTVPGRRPDVHARAQGALRRQWPALADALDALADCGPRA